MVDAGEHVVLLHGILRSHRHMAALARHLAHAGYTVHNLDYPSRRYDMAGLVQYLHRLIPARTQGAACVHCVGYSLGGVLARAYVAQHRPLRLGRVVQLAPPNGGSEVADWLMDVGAYRWLFGAAGQQLGTDQQAIAHLFAPIDYTLGVLAGDRCLDPISARVLPRPHDGKVSVASTKIDGMADHRVVHATHTFFSTHRKVMEETTHFLKHGYFSTPKQDKINH